MMVESKVMKVSDLNLRAGGIMNTVCHISALKTNYTILFELERKGVDIFIRNLENKTCY